MNPDRPESRALAASMFASIKTMFANGVPLSPHVRPERAGQYFVKHTGANYAQRRQMALKRRTRDKRRRLSPIELAPSTNRTYRKATR